MSRVVPSEVGLPRQPMATTISWALFSTISLSFLALALGVDDALPVAIAVVLPLGPIAYAAHGRTPIRLDHPMLWVSLPVLVGISLKSSVLLLGSPDSGTAALLRGHPLGDTLGVALPFVAVYLVALLAGFTATRHTGGARAPAQPVPRAAMRLAVLVGAFIAVLAVAFYIISVGGLSVETLSRKRTSVVGGVATSGAVFLRLASASAAIGLVFFSHQVADNERRARRTDFVAAGICLLAPVAMGFMGSNRSELLTTAILLLLVGLASGLSVRPRHALIVIAASAVVFVGMGSLRCLAQTAAIRECGPMDQLEGAFLSTESWLSLTKTADIVRYVPERVEYQNGATFVSALVAPVPRGLWPDKPDVRAEDIISVPILGLDPLRSTGAPPGAVGEFYLNFGALGVVTGGLLQGALLGWTWRRFLHTQSPGARVAMSMVTLHVAMRFPGGDFAGSAMPLLFGLLGVWTTGIIFRVHSKRGGYSSA